MKKPATPKRSGLVMDGLKLDRDRQQHGDEDGQAEEDGGLSEVAGHHPFLASSRSSWRSVSMASAIARRASSRIAGRTLWVAITPTRLRTMLTAAVARARAPSPTGMRSELRRVWV